MQLRIFMMRLVGSDGSLFELSIAGYQFPEIETDEYDSNWLGITIHVAQSRGEWTSTQPVLLTNEVAALADWFDAVARGEDVEPAQTFIEPNLAFRLLDAGSKGRCLAVYFELESRPPWAESNAEPTQDLFVTFPLSELDLARAAEELRQELARYPQRAVR